MKRDYVTTTQTIRQGPDKRETIRRILDAARLEFAAKGLADARIDVIAQQAGVTKQLVYHYFKGKTDLFACVLDESSEKAMSDLVAMDLDHLAPVEAMRAFLGVMFDQFQRTPSLGSLAPEGIRFHSSRTTPHARFPELAPLLDGKLRAILERGAENGDFKPNVDASMLFAAAGLLTTGVFTSPYLVSVLAGLDPGQPTDMAVWRHYTVDFVLAAICIKPSASPRPAQDTEPKCCFHYDGADLTWKPPLGEWALTPQAYTGHIKFRNPARGLFSANQIFGATVTAEKGDHTLRASITNAKMKVTSAIAPLLAAYRAAGTPASIAVADNDAVNDLSNTFISVGYMYAPGDWLVMAELGKTHTEREALLAEQTLGYITIGYRLGSVTPYVPLARRDTSTANSVLGVVPSLDTSLNRSIAAGDVSQTRTSLGARWDFITNMAFKTQFDHVNLDSGSAGGLVSRS